VTSGGLGERLVARLIDFALVGAVTWLLFSGLFGLGTFLSAFFVGCLTLAYFTLLESYTGRTAGKVMLKLRVFGAKGRKPTVEEALFRNCWVAPLVLAGVPLLGLLCVAGVAVAAAVIGVQINNDPMYAIAWHDRFARTRVLQGV
jgi:uncharacterized RDD family membrane protein YckC